MTERAIPGLWVDFGQATTSSGSYEIIYKITTPLAAESTKYEVAVIPKQTMYYRFQWAGDAAYAASNSDTIPVQVMPALGAPGNGTTITVGKKFSIKGSVTPGAPGGPAVKIKAYRQKGDGSWAGYKTYATRISGTAVLALGRDHADRQVQVQGRVGGQREVRLRGERVRQGAHRQAVTARSPA